MAIFDVHITGVCCHYVFDDSDIRTILVDGGTHPYFPHYAHIEVQLGGVVNSAGLSKLALHGQDHYERDGVIYEAYVLAGHTLEFPSADASLNLQSGFRTAVPHLPDVCRTFGGAKIQTFLTSPPSAPVAAHLNITAGDLSVVDTCEPTHFEPKHHDPPTNPGSDRRLATDLRLRLNVTGVPYVKVTPFGGAPSHFLLQPWVTQIRVGNLGEDGIRGIPELDAHHFLLYYMMADENSACYAIPVEGNEPGKGLGGGCSHTQYP